MLRTHRATHCQKVCETREEQLSSCRNSSIIHRAIIPATGTRKTTDRDVSLIPRTGALGKLDFFHAVPLISVVADTVREVTRVDVKTKRIVGPRGKRIRAA